MCLFHLTKCETSELLAGSLAGAAPQFRMASMGHGFKYYNE